MSSDVMGLVGKALNRAFSMGQKYWADADSESYSANARAEKTQEAFDKMRDEILAALNAQSSSSCVAPVANAPFGWVKDEARSDGMLDFTIRSEVAQRWRVTDSRVVTLYNLPYLAPPTDTALQARVARLEEALRIVAEMTAPGFSGVVNEAWVHAKVTAALAAEVQS